MYTTITLNTNSQAPKQKTNDFICFPQDKRLKALVASKRKNSKKKESDGGEIRIDWEKISTSLHITGRGADECKRRYTFLKASQVGKGPWTVAEDQKIVKMVNMYGTFTRDFRKQYTPPPAKDLIFFINSRSKEMESNCGATPWTYREAVQRTMAQPSQPKHQQVKNLDGERRQIDP